MIYDPYISMKILFSNMYTPLPTIILALLYITVNFPAKKILFFYILNKVF